MAIPSKRPTSPHLQVYKLPLTGLVSITHRITGVLLSLGLVLVVWLLSVLVSGQQAYADMQAIMSLMVFKVMYWGFIYALFFHLCHGIRHLLWDAGLSFEHAKLNQYVLIELAASWLLTLLTFILV